MEIRKQESLKVPETPSKRSLKVRQKQPSMSIKDAVKQIKGGDLSVENQNMSSNSHNLLNSSKFGGKFSNSGGRSPRNDSIYGNRSMRSPENQRKESSDDDSFTLKKEKKDHT